MMRSTEIDNGSSHELKSVLPQQTINAILTQDSYHCHVVTVCLLPIGTEKQPEDIMLSRICFSGHPNFLHRSIKWFVYDGHFLQVKPTAVSKSFPATVFV